MKNGTTVNVYNEDAEQATRASDTSKGVRGWNIFLT